MKRFLRLISGAVIGFALAGIYSPPSSAEQTPGPNRAPILGTILRLHPNPVVSIPVSASTANHIPALTNQQLVDFERRAGAHVLTSENGILRADVTVGYQRTVRMRLRDAQLTDGTPVLGIAQEDATAASPSPSSRSKYVTSALAYTQYFLYCSYAYMPSATSDMYVKICQKDAAIILAVVAVVVAALTLVLAAVGVGGGYLVGVAAASLVAAAIQLGVQIYASPGTGDIDIQIPNAIWYPIWSGGWALFGNGAQLFLDGNNPCHVESQGGSWVYGCGHTSVYDWAAQNQDGRIEIFDRYVGDNRVYHISQSQPGSSDTWWPSPAIIGNQQFDVRPVIGRDVNGQLEVMEIPANQLLNNHQMGPGGGWLSSWTYIDSAVVGNGVIVANGDGHLEYFVLGTTGDLKHYWENGINGPWIGGSMGGTGFSYDPVAAVTSDQRVEVWVADNTGTLWHNYQTAPNGSWSGWYLQSPGFATAVQPQAARNADGHLELFVQAPNGVPYHSWYSTSSGWSNWYPVSTSVAMQSPIVPGTNYDGRLELFAIDTAGNLEHAWQLAPNNGWSNWAVLSPPGCCFMGKPNTILNLATNGFNNTLTVEVVGANRNLHYIYQNNAGGSAGWTDKNLGGSWQVP